MFYLPEGNNKYYIEEYMLILWLERMGIDKEHIKNVKTKIVKDKLKNYIKGESKQEIIEVEKIIGGSRLTPNVSFFDNMLKVEGKDRRRKMENLTYAINDYVNAYGIKWLRNNYSEKFGSIIIDYYVDEDKYYIELDGNHRGLLAIMIGVNKLKAYVDYYYKNNDEINNLK